MAPSQQPALAAHRSNIREWYYPQARIAGPSTFQPLGRFHPSCGFDQHCSRVWRVCHTPCHKPLIYLENLHIHNSGCECRRTLAAIIRSSRAGNRGTRRGRCRLVRGSRARLGTGESWWGCGSICAGIAALALGFALESVGRHVAGAASAGLRAESALFSVFETIRPKSLDHCASLVRVGAVARGRPKLRFQNDSGLPQGPAGAFGASLACCKLAQRVPGMSPRST